MRKFIALLVLVTVFAIAIVPAPTQAQDEPGTIADIVVASATGETPEFTTLLAAVQAADPAVLEALSDPEAELTVFAPTDAAFAALFEALAEEGVTAEDLLADTEFLTEVLLYHVVDGAAFSSDVVALLEENEGAFTVQTLNGQYLDIYQDAEMMEGAIYIDDSMLVLEMVDIEASNGVIHVIDAVLVPETDTIADLVVAAATDEEAPEFTSLLAAVQAADPAILEALSDPEAELTVFAPTDAAFAALGEETLTAVLSSQPSVTAILQYHVFAGFAGTAEVGELFMDENGEMMMEPVVLDTLLEGAQITISIDEEGNVFVNEAQVVIFDIDAGNGIIHVIDAVLVPAQ